MWVLHKLVSTTSNGQAAILLRSDVDCNSTLANCYLAPSPGSERCDRDCVHQTSVPTTFIRLSAKGNHKRLHHKTVPTPRELGFKDLNGLLAMNDCFEREWRGFCDSPGHQEALEILTELQVNENSTILINR
jgi:hypothetical protein